MRLAVALAATLAALPAAAAGGIWCQADDDKVTIEVRSGVTRGMGNTPYGFGATVTIADEAVSDDLREVGFAVPSQYWFDDEALNLLLYREREPVAPRGSVTVKIMTRLTEEDQILEGRYEVAVDDVTAFGPDGGRRYSGRIGCSFD